GEGLGEVVDVEDGHVFGKGRKVRGRKGERSLPFPLSPSLPLSNRGADTGRGGRGFRGNSKSPARVRGRHPFPAPCCAASPSCSPSSCSPPAPRSPRPSGRPSRPPGLRLRTP